MTMERLQWRLPEEDQHLVELSVQNPESIPADQLSKIFRALELTFQERIDFHQIASLEKSLSGRNGEGSGSSEGKILHFSAPEGMESIRKKRKLKSRRKSDSDIH